MFFYHTNLSPYKDSDDFSEFVVFSNADKEGRHYSCSELVKTTMKHGSSISNHTIVNVIDYIYKSEYKFKSCASEIEQLRIKYCEYPTNWAIGQIKIHGDNQLSRKLEEICLDILKEKVSKIQDRYELPTDMSRFLLISNGDSSKLINPMTVTQVTFEEVVPSALWKAVIFTNEINNLTSHLLLFSDKEQWLTAQAEFKNIHNPNSR